MECYENRVSYYVSWVNVDNNTESDFDVTGEHMYNITGLVANGNYTISVQAVVDGVNSTFDSHTVKTGQPEVVCGEQPACSERNFTLYCKISPVYEDSYENINWTFNSSYITESDMYRISEDRRELEIFNVVSTTIGSYGCCIELKNGTFVEGMPYNLHPLGAPKPPQISVQTGISNIYISWEHDKTCFENYTFVFNVTWQEVDTTNTVGSTVNGTTFNIQDVEPGTNYSICVLAVSISDQRVKSDVCQYNRTQPIMPSTKPEDPIAIAAGTAVAVGVVIITVSVLIILIGCVVLEQRKRRAHSSTSGIPESVSYVASEGIDTGQPIVQQGSIRPVQDPPQTASQRETIVYAQLDHSGDCPVPAPPLEQVTYAEVENKPLRGPVQESSPPSDDNGRLPITHRKEKVVGMILTERDTEPCLDHATQEDNRNIRKEVQVAGQSPPSPITISTNQLMT